MGDVRLVRYLAFRERRPFRLDEASADTGIPEVKLCRVLRDLERIDRVREIREGIYIPISERRPVTWREDYRPGSDGVIRMLSEMSDWVSSVELSNRTGFSHVKVCRLLRTLRYLGLSEERREGRSRYYRKLREYDGEYIPWFWAVIAPATRYKSKGVKDGS